jgi:ABC-type uncharacterized transport system substrate-binding protein
MNSIFRIRMSDSQSDNLKSKIQNLKWLVGLLAISITFAMCGVVAQAQQPVKIPRIGFVAGTEGPSVKAFQRGLRDLGYIDGKNIFVEYRYVGEKLDRVQNLVAELVQIKVDVLVSGYFPAIRAAKQATTTIPLVVVTAQDPVATGLVDSLARRVEILHDSHYSPES